MVAMNRGLRAVFSFDVAPPYGISTFGSPPLPPFTAEIGGASVLVEPVLQSMTPRERYGATSSDAPPDAYSGTPVLVLTAVRATVECAWSSLELLNPRAAVN